MNKFAFVFPGQGSHLHGLMNGYADLAIVRQTFQEASDVLNQDLWHLMEHGSDSDLSSTINAQPLMLAAGVAVYRAWRDQQGALPDMMAGHSLGEYTALVAAGALTFRDALPLVRYRAECMQQAVPEGEGGIAAIIGLEDDAVRSVCAEAALGDVLETANFNSPGQVVIAGNHAAVLRGMELAKAKGAKRTILLPMSVPSHCSLLKGAAAQLSVYLEQVPMQLPQIPVLQNVDVMAYNTVSSIKDALIRQMYLPVRWVETILAFGEHGMLYNVECAPGRVLAGLNKRIATNQHALAINDSAALSLVLVAIV